MKILHSISSVNPKAGGPIEGIKQLSATKILAGHEIEVVSLDSPEDPWVANFSLPLHALGPSYSHFRYSPRLAPWLRVHSADYDAVVINGIWQYSSYAVWRALHRTDTPYFVFTHGMLDPWFKRTYPIKHIKKWLFWPWGDYRVLRDARAVLFTCEEERRLASQSFWLYQCTERVVNYGTASPPDDAETQKTRFLERFPQLADKRCLLFFGRVHEKKGADLLLKAFAHVLSTLPPVDTSRLHLVMAGPDDHAYAKELKNLAARLGLATRITWTGMLSGELKWGAFRISDAFILPSHQENFGIAVAEALACGVPVLISDQVNIWREIHDYRAGLVAPDTLEGTVELLVEWLGLGERERLEMGASGLRCFHDKFRIEGMASSVLNVFDELGCRRPARS